MALQPSRPQDRQHAAAADVVEQLRTIFDVVREELRAAEKSSPISGAQAWALSIIGSNDRIGVGGLAEAMGVHQSTASNLLKLLTDRGLVAMGRSAEDRRIVELALTAKGRRWLARVPNPFSGVLPAALAQLDGATLRRLREDLGRVVGLIQGPESSTGT